MKLRISLNLYPRPGFTLIELLVVLAIIAILSSLLLPSLAHAQRKVKEVNEINSARQLMLAWQLYADENGDAILAGYSSQIAAFDNRGNPLSSPVRDRYPWRLAPQLANNFRAIYVNESRHFLEKALALAHEDFVYRASLYPSMGYNSVFLGGDEQKFNPALASSLYGTGWLALRTAQIQRPAQLLAFASARSRPGDSRDEPGYYSVYPPSIVRPQWDQSFLTQVAPERFGNVHPRWGGRAVTAMGDGHAETLNAPQLRDMRRWCDAADRPDWTVQSLP